MLFSIALPQVVEDDHPALLARHVRRAEELGFARVWSLDSVVGGRTSHAPLLDGLHVLTAAGAFSERIGLAIAVIVLPRRNPALLAKELASIDHLTGGRLLVGVGLGVETGSGEALGFATDRRARRLEEGVGVMRAIWTQDEASYDGEVFRFSGAQIAPRPLQQPGPPIWVGAGQPPALRRAVRIGDGWIGAGSASSDDYLEQLRTVREELERAGRDPDAFPKAKRVYIAVEEDEREATERLAAVLDRMYDSPGMTERVAVCGTAERCAEELRRLLDAGADEVLLHPLYDPLGQLEAMAEVARLATR